MCLSATPGLSCGPRGLHLQQVNSQLPQVGSSSLTRDQPRSPDVGARSLSYWTTKECPIFICKTAVSRLFYLFNFDHALWHVGSYPRRGIEPMPPALEARSLSHWTTREVPIYPLYISFFTYLSIYLSMSNVLYLCIISLLPPTSFPPSRAPKGNPEDTSITAF